LLLQSKLEQSSVKSDKNRGDSISKLLGAKVVTHKTRTIFAKEVIAMKKITPLKYVRL